MENTGDVSVIWIDGRETERKVRLFADTTNSILRTRRRRLAKVQVQVNGRLLERIFQSAVPTKLEDDRQTVVRANIILYKVS
jgi:hypothetical protein